MQLLDARLVPFRRQAQGRSIPSWLRVGGWGLCKQGLSMQIHLLPEGEPVWSWFQAQETTRTSAVPTEPEAAQGLHGPRGKTELGEK